MTTTLLLTSKQGFFMHAWDFYRVAHNSPDWAEFIVNVPTRINGEVFVDHYNESRRIESVTNRMIEVIE